MKNLFLLISIFSTISIYSQSCGTEQYHLSSNQYQLNNLTNDPTTKHVFNVRFHVVYNDDGVTRTNNSGTAGLQIGENEVLNAIKHLNINFNQFNIFFKYYGYDKINNSNYLSNGNYGTALANMRSNHSIPDAFNIFIVNAVTGASAVAGYYFPYSSFDDAAFVTPWILCHEMGHSFGLLHTFFEGSGGCEHAARFYDPFASPALQFNADTKGDQIVDTHAFGNMSSVHFNNCNYIGGTIDCEGTQILPATVNGYFIAGPPRNNFMSSPDDDNCVRYFTPGQGVRMRNALIIVPERYDPTRNTIESLYKPFEELYVGGSTIISTEDLGNGNVIVCRNIQARHRFQPGFTYSFPDNDGVIDPMTATVNDTPLIINHDFNYGVIINQVDTLQRDVLLCTRGEICEEENFVSGEDMITSFIGSYNFTIEQWDQLKVADPNLYDYLESNKYHIIKKITDKGTIVQVTVYKN